MDYPENKKIQIDQEWYEIKSYLSLAEIILLTRTSVDAFDNGLLYEDDKSFIDDIAGYDKNHIIMEYHFNNTLLELVCEELTKVEYDILLSHSVFDILNSEIAGVDLAKQYIFDIIRDRQSIEYTLGKFFSKIIEKLPNTKDLQKLSKSVIKELGSEKNKDIIDNLKNVLNFKAEKII